MKLLYKYCAINNNTIDMLNHEYIYLCNADKLDDQFEGAINFDLAELKSEEGFNSFQSITAKNTAYTLYKILNIKDEHHKEEIRKILIRNNMSEAIDEYCSIHKFPIKQKLLLKNGVNKLLKEMDDHKEEFYSYLKDLLSVREKIGIGSLTPIKDNQVMWTMYGDAYKGVVIEYEIEDSVEYLRRVTYKNVRDFNPIVFIIKATIENYINRKDFRQMVEDYVIKSFSTKRSEWAFQKEERIIGTSNSQYKAKIKAIYVGKKISDENYDTILNISQKKGYKLYKQVDDYLNTRISYKTLKII